MESKWVNDLLAWGGFELLPVGGRNLTNPNQAVYIVDPFDGRLWTKTISGTIYGPPTPGPLQPTREIALANIAFLCGPRF